MLNVLNTVNMFSSLHFWVHMHNIVSKSWYISHAMRYFHETELEIWAGVGFADSFICLFIILQFSVRTKNLINIKVNKKKWLKNRNEILKQGKNTHSIVGWQQYDLYMMTLHSIVVWWDDLSKRYISFVSLYCSNQLLLQN